MAKDTIVKTQRTDANGALVVSYRPPRRQNWTAEQIDIENNPSIGPNAVGTVDVSGSGVSRFQPSGDTLSGLPFIPIPNGRTLNLRVTGASPNVLMKFTLWYDDGEG